MAIMSDNTADSGSGSLERSDSGWVVMAFYFKSEAPTFSHINDSGVFALSLQDIFAL